MAMSAAHQRPAPTAVSLASPAKIADGMRLSFASSQRCGLQLVARQRRVGRSAGVVAQAGRTAAPPAPAASFVADAPAELDGSPSTPNSKNMSPLAPDSTGLPARIPAEFGQLSYSKQYDHLFAKMPLDVKKPVPKPNPVAQQAEPDAKRVLLSSVAATRKRNRWLQRTWAKTDFIYIGFMAVMHGLCLLAPATFSWPMVGLFLVSYFVTGCLGITLSFHRQLSHRAFQTPKWLEYALAYCGVLAVQGDPTEWVSSHRFHHLHTDTPLDPHSPYEGFWWSHMGWLLDEKSTMERVGCRGNTSDMDVQPFYNFIQRTYPWHVVASFAALYALGGVPALVWGGALRAVWVYHITWFVNSASHVWGSQSFNTGDQSRNNWWVGILAFGEGWHNNHHAFEYSARHGFEKGQFDMTWMVISTLQKLGLASNVKLPSEKAQERLRFKPAAT